MSARNSAPTPAPSSATPRPATATAPEAIAAASDGAESVFERRYSLSTAIFLIMGICIGSGIFFKSDNVLVATDGNVWLGALMFVIAAFYIVFGGLTLSLYAARTAGAGGLVDYAGRFVSPTFARLIGWHYTFVYMPAITAIIFWVVGVYACQVFGLPAEFSLQVAIGCIALLACTALNALAPRLAGHLQNGTTLLKIVPLVAVGLIGIACVATGRAQVPPLNPQQISAAGFGWLAAAAPVAFSFDGWPIATSIAPELKDAKRNLPIALVVAPLCILALYLAYFLGISLTLGPEQVMAAGDSSLSELFVALFGESSRTWPALIAFLAILGVGNGLVLGIIRMPQALGLRGEVPASAWVAKVDARWGMPLHSAGIALVSVLVWMGIHYLVQSHSIIANGDISEVVICLTMLGMLPFYTSATRLWRTGEAETFRALVSPILALLVCAFIGISGLLEPTRIIGAAILVGLLVIAQLIWSKRQLLLPRRACSCDLCHEVCHYTEGCTSLVVRDIW